MPLPSANYTRLMRLTGLKEAELRTRFAEFERQFPRGQVSKEEFRLMSRQIMPASEVGPFVNNVYSMFDSNDDGRLDFEEFVLATSGRETGASHVDKMLWLFENVYDKDDSGYVSRSELEGILTTLLHMERITGDKTKEIMADIFKELDANHDGSITKAEFVSAASSCSLLCQILTSAADKEQCKRMSTSMTRRQRRSRNAGNGSVKRGKKKAAANKD